MTEPVKTMDQDIFKSEIKRLRVRFGDRAFDAEMTKLVWDEVSTMSADGFHKYVSTLIGHRGPFDPPLLAEFREARLFEERNNLKKETAGAGRELRKVDSLGFDRMLALNFPGAKSAKDALAIAKKKRQGGNDDGPGAA